MCHSDFSLFGENSYINFCTKFVKISNFNKNEIKKKSGILLMSYAFIIIFYVIYVFKYIMVFSETVKNNNINLNSLEVQKYLSCTE